MAKPKKEPQLDPDSGLIDPRVLIPYDRNARTHGEEQVEQIRAAIRTWGFTNPVLIDEKDRLLAGHGRQQAAIAEGLELVPFRRIRGLSDAQRRALILADNQLALNAGWDDKLLGEELGRLAAEDFDLGLIGFDDKTLVSFLASSGGHGDPDEVPPPPAAAVSSLGDVWLLGDHRLMCGDATSAEDVATLLGEERPELTLTDPPYGIGYEYAEHDDADNAANARLVAAAFALAPWGKVWTPGPSNLARDIRAFGKAKAIYWHKGFAAAGSGLGGASTVEPILVLNPPAKKLPNDYLDFPTEREKLGEDMLREHHPCPKPAALFAHLLESFATEGGLVYEPFAGSGTTIIACQQEGRVCRALELTPIYVDVAVRRWCEFTGDDATRERDGASFRELAGLDVEPEEESD